MRLIKDILSEGRNVVGTMVGEFVNPNIAKMIDICGFDFFVVDCEHGYFDYYQVANIIAVGTGAGIPVIVRIPEVSREVVLKYTEMGAQGFLVPQVESAKQVRDVVSYCKYAPEGSRGVSLGRAHAGYEKVNGKEYMKKANDEKFIIAQIESPSGVENIDDILSVDGVNAALIGPNDFSQSYGIYQEYSNPIFIEAVQKVVDAAKMHNKYSGIHIPDIKILKYWADQGMKVLMWNSDVGMMMASGIEGVKQIRNF